MIRSIISALFLCSSLAISQTVSFDSVISKVPILKFPELGRYSGVQGRVKLTANLHNGHLENVTAEESPKILSNAAITFVRQAEFKATASGTLVIDFKFILIDAADTTVPWQRFKIDSEASLITIEATRKISIQKDFFE